MGAARKCLKGVRDISHILRQNQDEKREGHQQQHEGQLAILRQFLLLVALGLALGEERAASEHGGDDDAVHGEESDKGDETTHADVHPRVDVTEAVLHTQPGADLTVG